MKITLNIDFDTGNPQDLLVLNNISELIRKTSTPLTKAVYEEAWKRCSWEIIAFAVTVLKIHDGASTKGVFALFDSLCNPEESELCGPLTERAISSRVGRTAVICKNLGDFRLMEIADTRNDHAKRVYLTPDAHDALMKLLTSDDWGKDFNKYLLENGLPLQEFNDIFPTDRGGSSKR